MFIFFILKKARKDETASIAWTGGLIFLGQG